MDDTLKTVFQNQFEHLPRPVQEALRTFDLRGALERIATNNTLRLDQSGILEQEVILVLFGMENPNDFAKNLERSGAIPPDLAQVITREVNERIFEPIRRAVIAQPTAEQAPTAPTAPTPPKTDALAHASEKLSGVSYAPPQERTAGGVDPYREPIQ